MNHSIYEHHTVMFVMDSHHACLSMLPDSASSYTQYFPLQYWYSNRKKLANVIEIYSLHEAVLQIMESPFCEHDAIEKNNIF